MSTYRVMGAHYFKPNTPEPASEETAQNRMAQKNNEAPGVGGFAVELPNYEGISFHQKLKSNLKHLVKGQNSKEVLP